MYVYTYTSVTTPPPPPHSYTYQPVETLRVLGTLGKSVDQKVSVEKNSKTLDILKISV